MAAISLGLSCASTSQAEPGTVTAPIEPQDDPVLLNKYKQSHLESYMEDNQRVTFCPSKPWCGRAIEVRMW
jgi:hypothetical protein